MKFFTIVALFYSLSIMAAASDAVEHFEVRGSESEFFHLNNPAQETLQEQQLKQRSLFHSEQIWDQFANFSTASSTNRLRYFKIRGIGERSEYDTIPSNSVGLFYDHIDLGGLGGVLALYDISQVEVLKGPQTFLYGDSSLGGNVLLSSSEVSAKQRSLWGGFGSQSRHTMGTSLHTRLSEVFSMKFGVQKHESDGFFYNSYYQRFTSARDEIFANFGWQLDWGASRLRASHIYGQNDNGNDLWNTDGSYTVLSDKLGEDDQLTHGHSLEWTGPVTETLQYLMIGSYSHSDQLVSYDEDWNNNAFWNQVSGWEKNYDYFRSYNRRKGNLHLKSLLQHQWGQWDVSYGIHFYQKTEKTDVNSFRNSDLRETVQADYKADKLAFLANLNYHLSLKSTLNLSTRIEQQDIEYQDSDGFSDQKHNQALAFNLVYRYLAGSHIWRALVSRGFKGAGFNPEINLSPEQQAYEPEYAMNYELSWEYQKSNYRNTISLFYMDRRHHQITTSSQDDPSDPSQFTLFVDNAAQSHHYGLEWQGDWTATSFLTLQTSVGLMQAQFVDYQLRNRSYAGRELAHSPSYTFSFTTHFRLAPWLHWNINSTGRDGFYFSNSHDQSNASNVLLSSSLHGIVSSNLRVSLWGKNLFNKRYSQRGFYFGNEPPDFESRLYQQNGNPFEWGLRAEYQF